MDCSWLEKFDKHLAECSYVGGYELVAKDWTEFEKINSQGLSLSHYQHIQRWYQHLQKLRIEKSSKSCPCNMPPSLTEACGDTNLPQVMLNYLKLTGEFNTLQYAKTFDIDHQKVVGALKSLQTNEGLLDVEDVVAKEVVLTAEGKDLAENGSYEAKVFQAVGTDGASQADINKLPFGKVGISKALAAGWISVDKSSGTVRLLRKVNQIVDKVREDLNVVAMGKSGDLDAKVLQDLKKRKLIMEVIIKSFLLRKGPSFAIEISKPEVDLTAEMIASGSWKTKAFKKYNFDALGVIPSSGHLHPLMKVRNEFRNIFFQMGFTEMATNRYVESSFWNFDALFQPQQHPARDAHDTFFIADPQKSSVFPMDYLEKVKNVHSHGGYGSKGYNYDWKLEEAQKNVLRTHTTAVSARLLYKLAQEGFKPSKMFSIDRVFRNETLDATHLAEFHQVEGVVAEKDLSLAHVMGLFTEFFRKCGITNLRFKPTYNPYTEPSMEIFAFHSGLNKWVEIGNSGMFRPEMLLPMGFPPDVNVAGYGLSLERPTMIRYKLNNIRDLFGPKVDLQMIYDNPMCRLDKN